MKKRLIAALVVLSMVAVPVMGGCSAPQDEGGSSEASSSTTQASMRAITDMAGRTVEIPSEVDSVYCAVPTGEAMVATLAPEKIIGWVNTPTAASLEYLPPQLADLPVIGGWMGQQVTANIEDIITLDPDVIIYVGTDSALATDEVPDQIQNDTGIPVVCAPSSLEKTAEVYRTLGGWIGEAERGEQLASYYEEHLQAAQEKIATVPESDIPTVYYAENANGLATEPAGSIHAEVLDFCRVKNVADVPMQAGQGLTEVSVEQVIAWDPEVIICHSGYLLASDIESNSQWADIQAVKDGKVYTIPAVPFNWFDRPPNVMRLMGIEWLASTLYPELDIDIDAATREFFSLFYKSDLTDEQVTSLLNQDQISFED